MGRRLRGRQKSHRGKDAGTKDVGTCPLSSVAIPDSSSTDEAINSTSELSRCPTLQPITSFSALSGLSNVVLPSGMSAGTSRAHVINNSSVIEILVHLLCREREPDPERRKKLFLALCKVIKQWNSPMYIPLHSFSELQDFRIGLLRKFEFLFEEVQSQIHSETTNLIIPSFQLLPTGSPLTQLALTDAYQHQFLDDRYSREFTEISPLGKGGFGSVVKARSKLDGHDYAIKIIIMDKKDKQTNKKILREVRALALLDHPNIVRYHTTWLQLYTVTPQHWPHNHRMKRRHPGDKVRINNFFPTSQVKIQELSSSLEESSGGIVFADVSRSKSSFMKSADEETEESSSGIVFAEVSRSKTSFIKTIDEATEESSGGIVFADVSRSKSNLKKKVNVCQTINETGESSFDLTTCSSGNKNGKIIQKGSVLNGDRFKLNINSIYSESTHSHLVNSEHSRSLLSDSSYSKITVNKDDSVCKKRVLYSPPSSSSLVPYEKHLREAQMTLFIQMGLCGETLADWISKRNAVQAPGIWLDSVNPKQCLEIFRQLLLAVQYIHTQNIIHRDLKPPNVFFTKDGKHIQLGDFGLARHLPDVVQPETDDSEKMTCLTPITNNTSNTGGVGTPIYSPPELKFGGIYGNKSDMYNLGIILLELFHPFKTGSERVKVISDLKEKQYIDSDLKHRYPKVASWILKLTDQDQSKRLTAAELLELISNRESLKEHYSDHFKSDSYTVVQETKHVRHRVQISESGSQNSRNSLNSRLIDLKISQPEELGSGSCPPGSGSTPVDLRNLKSILKENKDKDKEIEKLREENIKLQKVIAQLREQINQSVS